MSSPTKFQAPTDPAAGSLIRLSPIHVDATWDADAGVWVATCDDIPGLATEADTIEALSDKVSVMIPELIEANALTFDQAEIAMEIHAVKTYWILVPRARP
jgi:predicted RNase H-like HicB family nuclease